MPRKRQIIQLSKSEQSSLTKILSRGKSSAHEQRRARVLDLLARTEHPAQIANLLKVGIATVYNIQKRFLEEGFGAALYDKPRSGKPPAIKPEEKARITALACSEAPAGYARWTLRLLAEKAVEMNYIDSISHMEVSRILKKTLSNRINKNNGASERQRANIWRKWKMCWRFIICLIIKNVPSFALMNSPFNCWVKKSNHCR